MRELAAARAIAGVRDALAHHPLSSMPVADRPYLNVAGLYARAGRLSEAQQLFAEYERVVPEGLRRGQPGRHGVAAEIAMAKGRPQDAIAALRELHNECPTCDVYDLAETYDRMGQADSALTLYQRFAEAPTWGRLFQSLLAVSYKRLGELYEARGDRAKAKDMFDRVLAGKATTAFGFIAAEADVKRGF